MVEKLLYNGTKKARADGTLTKGLTSIAEGENLKLSESDYTSLPFSSVLSPNSLQDWGVAIPRLFYDVINPREWGVEMENVRLPFHTVMPSSDSEISDGNGERRALTAEEQAEMKEAEERAAEAALSRGLGDAGEGDGAQGPATGPDSVESEKTITLERLFTDPNLTFFSELIDVLAITSSGRELSHGKRAAEALREEAKYFRDRVARGNLRGSTG